MARTVTFKGNTMHLIGPELSVGDPAPNVTCTAVDFSDISGDSLAGNVVLVSVTPSLDTGVCDIQAKHFNKAAASLGDHVKVVNVSLDLPPAIKRWCGAADADNILAVSDYKERQFGKEFGVLIDELKLLTRAVFVIDGDGTITYKEIVPEVTDEPNYDAALEAVKKIA